MLSAQAKDVRIVLADAPARIDKITQQHYGEQHGEENKLQVRVAES